MKYKGYTAGPIDFDPREITFSGTVSALKDSIHFEGATARELARAFRASIDSFLKYCEEAGPQPGKPLDLAAD
jgi:predicted HicB family RNase H-like nuclease